MTGTMTKAEKSFGSKLDVCYSDRLFNNSELGEEAGCVEGSS